MELWQQMLRQSVDSGKDLVERFGFDKDLADRLNSLFHTRINPYYLSLIRYPGDPIWLQCVPDARELLEDGFPDDPLALVALGRAEKSTTNAWSIPRSPATYSKHVNVPMRTVPAAQSQPNLGPKTRNRSARRDTAARKKATAEFIFIVGRFEPKLVRNTLPEPLTARDTPLLLLSKQRKELPTASITPPEIAATGADAPMARKKSSRASTRLPAAVLFITSGLPPLLE